jgi:hypothetical protein
MFVGRLARLAEFLHRFLRTKVKGASHPGGCHDLERTCITSGLFYCLQSSHPGFFGGEKGDDLVTSGLVCPAKGGGTY